MACEASVARGDEEPPCDASVTPCCAMKKACDRWVAQRARGNNGLCYELLRNIFSVDAAMALRKHSSMWQARFVGNTCLKYFQFVGNACAYKNKQAWQHCCFPSRTGPLSNVGEASVIRSEASVFRSILLYKTNEALVFQKQPPVASVLRSMPHMMIAVISSRSVFHAAQLTISCMCHTARVGAAADHLPLCCENAVSFGMLSTTRQWPDSSAQQATTSPSSSPRDKTQNKITQLSPSFPPPTTPTPTPPPPSPPPFHVSHDALAHRQPTHTHTSDNELACSEYFAMISGFVCDGDVGGARHRRSFAEQRYSECAFI